MSNRSLYWLRKKAAAEDEYVVTAGDMPQISAAKKRKKTKKANRKK